MNNKRPFLLTAASICLVILVILSAGLTLARNFGLLGPTFGATGLTNRSVQYGERSG